MLLVVDVGNTNIVLGVYNEKKLVAHWRISTDRVRTTDEYGMIISNLFLHDPNLDKNDVEAVIISSVVPPLNPTLERVCARYFNKKPMFVGPGIKTGISIKYENPRELGSDLIVDAVAAYDKYGGNLIIIDFGTATTYSAVLDGGIFLGGAISPGVGISAEALFSRTAKLPRIEIKNPGHVIGKNTVTAMQSGVLFGYVGQVEGIVARMKREMPEDTKVVATGGLANIINAETDVIDHVDPMMMLEGLRLIYERNK